MPDFASLNRYLRLRIPGAGAAALPALMRGVPAGLLAAREVAADPAHVLLLHPHASATAATSGSRRASRVSAFRLVFLIVGLDMALSFPVRGIYGFLYAHIRYGVVYIFGILKTLVRTALIVLALERGHGIVAIAAATLAGDIAEYAANVLYLRARYPEIIVRLRDFSKSMAGRLYDYSIYSFVSATAKQLRFNVARLRHYGHARAGARHALQHRKPHRGLLPAHRGERGVVDQAPEAELVGDRLDLVAHDLEQDRIEDEWTLTFSFTPGERTKRRELVRQYEQIERAQERLQGVA